MDSLPTTNQAKGEATSTKESVLHAGAAMVQNFDPPKQLCAHLHAFHTYASNPGQPVEANHYCEREPKRIRKRKLAEPLLLLTLRRRTFKRGRTTMHHLRRARTECQTHRNRIPHQASPLREAGSRRAQAVAFTRLQGQERNARSTQSTGRTDSGMGACGNRGDEGRH